MKGQLKSAVLRKLPIVGSLKIYTRDDFSLCRIEVVDSDEDQSLSPFFKDCEKKIEDYLLGKVQKLSINVDLQGLTAFQKDVLKEMKKIPHGQVRTYKDLAQKLNSKAYQAIGNACGSNPLLLIYPCHRVIGSKGLGGFAHGLHMKKELLKNEGFKL